MRPVSSGHRLDTDQKSVGDGNCTNDLCPEVEMQLVETISGELAGSLAIRGKTLTSVPSQGE
jgi:hypothetical protein